jgi:hypothetical protein
VAFVSRVDPPLRGDIATHLAPGVCRIGVDPHENRSVISYPDVREGLRFTIALDGAGTTQAASNPDRRSRPERGHGNRTDCARGTAG